MAEVKLIQESKKSEKKSSKELLNEIFQICRNEQLFTDEREKFDSLVEKVKEYKEKVKSKDELIEKSESYENSLQNKLEDMNQRILDKRIRLLEDLGSNL